MNDKTTKGGLFFTKEELFNQVISLGEGAAGDRISECRLTGCRIVVFDSTSCTFRDNMLLDCVVEAKNDFEMTTWNCCWESCRFLGHYHSCGFGGADDQRGGVEVFIRNCDFSKATLHVVWFSNCEPKAIRFPTWPHFTVVKPKKNFADWNTIDFPKRKMAFRVYVENFDESIDAVTFHYPTFAKRLKLDLEPDKVRKLIEGRSYIIL